MSASVCSIDCIGTLYSCVNEFRPLVAAHLFPVHFQAVTLACTLAMVTLYWHDLILWPQSDRRPAEKVSEWIRSTTESDFQVIYMYVASDRSRAPAPRAQRALQYVLMQLEQLPGSWPLAAARAADMCVALWSTKVTVPVSDCTCTWPPGVDWTLALTPAHTSCVYSYIGYHACMGLNF